MLRDFFASVGLFVMVMKIAWRYEQDIRYRDFIEDPWGNLHYDPKRAAELRAARSIWD